MPCPTWSWTRAATSPPRGQRISRKPRHFSRTSAETQSRSWI